MNHPLVRTPRLFLAIIVSVLTCASLVGLSQSSARATTYNIGDTGPGGGVVFITPSTPGNATGLFFETRLSGANLNACQVPVVVTAEDVTIGAGANNTVIIRNACAANGGNTVVNSAFLWVKAQTIGGFSDWFIPNPGEADRIQAERGNPSIGALIGGLNSGLPWLSRVEAPGTGFNQFVYEIATGNTAVTTNANGGVRNFFISRTFSPSTSSQSADSLPQPILQQFGAPELGNCDASEPDGVNWSGVPSGGWGQSWARWMNGGTGGAVCTRTLTFSGGLTRWIVGS